MSDFQKCQRCGEVFLRVDRTGPTVGGMGDFMFYAYSDDKVCPHCGGSVIWVDEKGAPLSPYKRMVEANRHMRLGCLWGIVALIGFLILFYFGMR